MAILEIAERCSWGDEHLFMYLYGLGHSTLQGGQWEPNSGLSLIC